MTTYEIELIKKMRNENKSYNEIAAMLGKSKDSISWWCRQNSLGGSRSKDNDNNKDIETREKNFKINFENKHKNFTYISGYTNNCSPIIIKCNTCNTEREINADSLRSDNIKCKKCSDNKKINNKQYYELNKDRIKQYNEWFNENNKEKRKECNKKYYDKNKEMLNEYSKQWKKDNKNYEKQYYEDNKEKLREYRRNWFSINKERYKGQRRISKQKRRAKLKNLPATLTIEQWKQTKENFNNQCAYCGKQLKNLTQDHFIPLSKDGPYTADNIIPACRSCNTSKNNKDFFEWYPKKEFYNEEREQKILEHLKYITQNNQQLKLAL